MVTGVVGSNMAANIIGTPVGALKETAPVKSDRRSNKPIMEKRRRARINNCLNELKTLILDATKKDPARHSKLEKADILEKTVKHLQELQRQQAAMQQVADPKVINKFKAGFADCATEVSRFPGLDPAIKRRLLQHLSNCINGVKSELHHHQRQMVNGPTQMLPSPPSSPEQDQHHLQQQHVTAAAATHPFLMSAQVQHTMNGYFLPNGMHVIPTKLPNGSIALVLPQGLPQHQQQQAQSHAQAQLMQQHQLSAAQAAALMTMPTRTASTSSASSNSSSVYERTLCSPANSVTQYAPPSPANSYEAMECKPSVIQHAPTLYQQQQMQQEFEQEQQQHQQNQQPLSLVIKKDIKIEDEQPWRPW
ncbi:protein hairy [Eurosta solidaginis]|uniref:protein hairy n=1 Tax=Eurosta solidaginis TaxID=178769 RepID=UPI0035307FE2